MKMPFKRIILALIICSLLSLTGCAAATTTTPPLQKVTLQLKWFHQWQFAGYYAAVEKGYFRDSGLDVTIVEGGPGIDVDTEVLEGRADFGILASELLVKWQQGEPLVALAPIIQHSIRALMVRADAKIDAPSELLGKKIVLTMNENPEMLAMFKVEGIPVEMLDINPQTQTSEQEFLDGKVDVVVGSIANQPYQFGLKGVNVHIIRPITYGIDFYGDTLFTSQQKLKADPKLVEAFLAATKRGWEYAFEHRQELAELIHQKYAPAKTVDQLVFEANALYELTQPDLVEIGHQNPGRWQHIADTYASLGIIAPVTSLSGFLYSPPDTFNQRLLTGIFITLGIALLITFLGIVWITLLRRQVALRTEDLNKVNLNLQNEVTERKLAEENVRKLNDELETRVAERTARLDSVNKELSAFSSSVSHDLRAPLRRIQNYAVIIGSEKANLLDDEGKDHLKRIQVNAESLNTLIENLLRLTKISQTEMALETVDLSALAREICDEYAASDPLRTVDWQIEDHLTTRADPTLVRQMLTNLIGNAWKYTARQIHPVIEIFRQPDTEPPTFAIRDNGDGFNPLYVDKLFKPFSRLHAPSEFEGNGIGLATVQRIANRHGGSVWAEGKENQGAVFYFTLGK